VQVKGQAFRLQAECSCPQGPCPAEEGIRPGPPAAILCRYFASFSQRHFACGM
jgi:hypothetical protein